jgi:hypothetical protein
MLTTVDELYWNQNWTIMDFNNFPKLPKSFLKVTLPVALMGLTVGTFCLAKGRIQGQTDRVLTSEDIHGRTDIVQEIKPVVENTPTK